MAIVAMLGSLCINGHATCKQRIELHYMHGTDSPEIEESLDTSSNTHYYDNARLTGKYDGAG